MMKKQQSFLCIGTTTIGKRGQIVIPADIRKKLEIKTGEKFIIFLTPSDMIVIVPAPRFEKIISELDKNLNKLKKFKKIN